MHIETTIRAKHKVHARNKTSRAKAKTEKTNNIPCQTQHASMKQNPDSKNQNRQNKSSTGKTKTG